MIDAKFLLYVSVLRHIRDNRLFRASPELVPIMSGHRLAEVILAELEQARITESEFCRKSPIQQAARFLLLVAHQAVLGSEPPEPLRKGEFFADLVNLVRAYHERPRPAEIIDADLSDIANHILRRESQNDQLKSIWRPKGSIRG
jgi:hypothetical protein